MNRARLALAASTAALGWAVIAALAILAGAGRWAFWPVLVTILLLVTAFWLEDK